MTITNRLTDVGLILLSPIMIIPGITLFTAGASGNRTILNYTSRFKLWIITKHPNNYFLNNISQNLINLYDLGDLIKNTERKYLYNSRNIKLGDPFILLNGVWVCSYDEVSRIINNDNEYKTNTIGTLKVCVPEIFHPLTLIFHNDERYKIMKRLMIQNVFILELFKLPKTHINQHFFVVKLQQFINFIFNFLKTLKLFFHL